MRSKELGRYICGIKVKCQGRNKFCSIFKLEHGHREKRYRVGTISSLPLLGKEGKAGYYSSRKIILDRRVYILPCHTLRSHVECSVCRDLYIIVQVSQHGIWIERRGAGMAMAGNDQDEE